MANLSSFYTSSPLITANAVSTLTANNATFAYGKAEDALSVNNAIFLGGSAANTYAPKANPTFTGNTSIAGLSANGSLGTNGQVLTSNGSTAYWNTLNVAAGINSDPTTTISTKTVNFGAGSTTFVGVASISSTKQLLVVRDTSNNYYACVYDSATDTMGASVLIAATTNNDTVFKRISDTAMLVCFGTTGTNTLNALVLTFSGTTITVGTAATNASAGSYALQDPILLGSTYVLGTRYAPTGSGLNTRLIAMTVSGSTVTLGTPVQVGYANYSNADAGRVFAYSSTQGYMMVYQDGDFTKVWGFTVSGTTITLGTPVNLDNDYPYLQGYGQSVNVMSNGSHVILLTQGYSGFTFWAKKLTMSTTTVTITSTTVSVPSGYYGYCVPLSGSKMLVVGDAGAGNIRAFVVDASGSISATSPTTIVSPFTSSYKNIPYIFPGNGTVVLNTGYYQATVSESGGAVVVTYSNKDVVLPKFSTNATVEYNSPYGAFARYRVMSFKVPDFTWFNNFVVGTSGKYYPYNAQGVSQSYNPTTSKWEAFIASVVVSEKLDPNDASCTWAIDGQSTASTSRTFYRLQYT